ncbi:MAG: hypothetical protein R2783_05780 [Gelidibacter sp.]
MKTITLFLGSMLIGMTNFAQTVHTVDNRIGTTAQFSSVQDAADAANEGDFIYVHPSETNYGNLTIRKTLHIRGLGHNPELNGGEHAIFTGINLNKDDAAGTSSSNSTISGIEANFIGFSSNANYTNVRVSNCLITSLLDLLSCTNTIADGNLLLNASIRFSTTGSTSNVVSNNIFNWTNNSGSFNMITNMNNTNLFLNNIIIISGSSDIFRNCNLPVVKNNLFLFADDVNAPISVLLDNSTVNFQNCLTFSYGAQTIDILSGTDNLDNVNPQLLDLGTPEDPVFSYDKNYAISSGSPAQNAGEDGTDLGIFGLGFNFSMNGYPFDLPYPTSINIQNPILQPGGTLQVELSAEGN